MTFAGFSHGIALLVRKEASMIAAANFVGLPLMFISAILIPPRQMPHWIEVLSRFNPVNWGVHAARNAIVGGRRLGRERHVSRSPCRRHRLHVIVRHVVLPRVPALDLQFGSLARAGAPS